jgi:hypothetical protein
LIWVFQVAPVLPGAFHLRNFSSTSCAQEVVYPLLNRKFGIDIREHPAPGLATGLRSQHDNTTEH